MKIRLMVEVIEDGKTIARKVRQAEVSQRATKLYEMMGGDPSFIAEDIISGALRTVDPNVATAKNERLMESQPAVDERGKSKGMSKLDEMLGLDVIEAMMRKDQNLAGR